MAVVQELDSHVDATTSSVSALSVSDAVVLPVPGRGRSASSSSDAKLPFASAATDVAAGSVGAASERRVSVAAVLVPQCTCSRASVSNRCKSRSCSCCAAGVLCSAVCACQSCGGCARSPTKRPISAVCD